MYLHRLQRMLMNSEPSSVDSLIVRSSEVLMDRNLGGNTCLREANLLLFRSVNREANFLHANFSDSNPTIEAQAADWIPLTNKC